MEGGSLKVSYCCSGLIIAGGLLLEIDPGDKSLVETVSSLPVEKQTRVK